MIRLSYGLFSGKNEPSLSGQLQVGGSESQLVRNQFFGEKLQAFTKLWETCHAKRKSDHSHPFDRRRLVCAGDDMIDALYDLIGGRSTIWAATESCYKRVLADDNLRRFFKRTDMAHLQSRQSMFLSMLLGGRVVYTGKDIHEAHSWARNHGLNDANYDAFLDHFRAALEEVGVNAEKAEKVIELLEARRDAVLDPRG